MAAVPVMIHPPILGVQGSGTTGGVTLVVIGAAGGTLLGGGAVQCCQWELFRS